MWKKKRKHNWITASVKPSLNSQTMNCPLHFCLLLVAQSLRCVWLFVTPWTAAYQAPLSFTVSWTLLKFMPLTQWCLSHSLSLSFRFAFNLSQDQDLFQRVGSSHQVAKVLEFQLQHPSFQWILRSNFHWSSLVAQLVKNPPATQDNWVWSLCWEDPLEKRKATQFNFLAWRIPWTV